MLKDMTLNSLLGGRGHLRNEKQHFLIQATGDRAASKSVSPAAVSSTQIFKFGIMRPITCFIASVNCLC